MALTESSNAVGDFQSRDFYTCRVMTEIGGATVEESFRGLEHRSSTPTQQNLLAERLPWLSAIAAPAGAMLAVVMLAMGVLNLGCAKLDTPSLGTGTHVLPVLPWLPSKWWLAFAVGALWSAASISLFFSRLRNRAAMILALLLATPAVVWLLPVYLLHIEDIGLRTVFFEALSLAAVIWLAYGASSPLSPHTVSRYVIALSLVVFGADHFQALGFIASLLPGWIPFHVFWVAFFGVALVLLGIASLWIRWASTAFLLAGSIFGLWVLTLHLPRVLGWYGVPGAPKSPDEWSSLFIAAALWFGLWAAALPRRVSLPAAAR